MQIEAIDYVLDGVLHRGQLVYRNEGADRLPGLLLAPDRFGVTDDAVRRAGILARLGYVVFVVDMYGARHRPTNIVEAAPLVDAVRAQPTLARARMTRAFDALNLEGNRRGLLVPALRAAVGFCFGGGNALELARSGAPIQAAVSIHGDLITGDPAGPGEIKASILAIHGAADPVVPKSHRDAFEAEMAHCGADWEMTIFGKLSHAFTDASAALPGVAEYNPYATDEAYLLTQEFIDAAFAAHQAA